MPRIVSPVQHCTTFLTDGQGLFNFCARHYLIYFNLVGSKDARGMINRKISGVSNSRRLQKFPAWEKEGGSVALLLAEEERHRTASRDELVGVTGRFVRTESSRLTHLNTKYIIATSADRRRSSPPPVNTVRPVRVKQSIQRHNKGRHCRHCGWQHLGT